MPAPYLPDKDLLSVPGSKADWGKYVVELNGDKELMLAGLRDYVYSIKGKKDITREIQEYFKKNGYDFDDDEEEDDEDW
jgi:N-acetyl-anhydromuramyl-L-alanine amidase AmpD